MVQRIDAARNDHVAVVGFQLSYGRLDCGQCRGARCIHSVVRPTEIETVGNSTGCYIRNNSRKGVLGPFREFLFEVFGDFIGIFIEEEWQRRAKAVAPGKLTRTPSESQDDRSAVTGKWALQVVGVFECRVHRFQCEELKGLDGRKCVRGHAVADGIEWDCILKGAPLAIAPVFRFGIRVEIELPIPSVFGNFRNCVDLVQNIFPVFF